MRRLLHQGVWSQAEERLAAQERLYKSVTDNASVSLFIMDEQQQCVFMNPAAEALTGYTLEETRGRPLHEVVHHTRPDGSPYPLSECPIDQAFPKNDREQGEEVFVHKDGHFYDVAFTASPVRDENGVPIGTIIEVQDISHRKAREARIAFLMKEVNHRAKNLLSVVCALARQTAKDAQPNYFVEELESRLEGLAASQDLIIRGDWQHVDTRELARSQLAPLVPFFDERVMISGDAIAAVPSAAQTIGMALHELGTNAVKYGSLSVPTGRVELSWRAEGTRFLMHWVEEGGPEVDQPRRFGFGHAVTTRVVSHALRGTVDLSFDVGGLRWSLECPLRNVTEDGPSSGQDGVW